MKKLVRTLLVHLLSLGLCISFFAFNTACDKAAPAVEKKTDSAMVPKSAIPKEGIAAWPNLLLIGKDPPPVNSSTVQTQSPKKTNNVVGFASVLALAGCSQASGTSTETATTASCPEGQVSTGHSSYPCCYADYPYLCGNPPKCYTQPCSSSSSTSSSGSSGSSSGGSGCTATQCCGGLYQCNGRCYATCTPGSQPCCTTSKCVCYTPCC